YENCSFSSNGQGTFKGSEKSDPNVGKKQFLEKVEEVRLEILVDSWKLKNVISALKITHPYEEPAFDIYELKNENANYGFGAIGSLNNSMTKNEFLDHVCKSLKTNNLRFANNGNKKVKRVAVCGGSGSDLMQAAIEHKADAFVTADVKYHSFQDGEDKILYIDAGHYETEIHSLNAVKRKLEKYISENDRSVKIYKYTGSTNPVKHFIK
ncbi:MAG: Nif3-like dinuclear metal center hexameric protein, partial [Ignavibacteriae bacterium]|nr:Nif3-like dinuclear metal center hexameric protein [Ignavibacteriota bacterium]